MKTSRKLFSFIASCVLSSFAQADANTDALTKLLLDIHTLKADFVQTVNDKTTKRLQQSSGSLALERPGKFRWEIKKPNPQLIIANGSKLWIYDPDLQQVTVRAFSKSTGQTPAYLLSDSTLTIDKDFTVKQKPVTSQIAGKQIYELTPKEKDNMFASIRLSFIQKNISEMQLEDHLGHVTTIAFKQVKVGDKLSNNLFTFTPAKNVDVIDETKKQ